MARRILCAIALLAASVSPVLAGERFLVEMELWLNGEQHGTPMVIVPAGESASVAKTDPSGENGWRVELEVEPPAPHEGAPAGALWLHVGVHQLVDGEWDHLADSILGVPEGQTATLSMVEGEVSDPTPENSVVYLTARTSRLYGSDQPER